MAPGGPVEDEPERASRAPAVGALRRLGRVLGALVSGFLLLVLILCAGLWLRLATGPLELHALVPFVEREASARLPGARITFGGATLALAPEAEGGGASLSVSNVVLIDDKDGPFAQIPAISAHLRFGDLLRGVFDPSDVTLSGISVRLLRDPSGAFRLGFGGIEGAGADDGAASFGRLIDGLTADENLTGIAALEADAAPRDSRARLRLRDASIVYLDQFAGRTYISEDAEVDFIRGRRGVAARARVELDGGAHGTVTGRFRGWRSNAGHVRFIATFENAAPADIAGQIPALDWMAAFDAPVSGRLEAGMNAAGDLTALEGRFTAGAGLLRLGDGAEERFASAGLDFVFDPETQRFQIEKAALDANSVSLAGGGFVQVGRDEDGMPVDAVAQLDFSDLRLSVPQFLDAPLEYRSGRLTGRVTLAPLSIEIGELRLERDRMSLGAAGRLWPAEDGWRADMTVSGRDISLAEMMAHWPKQAAPGARVWMLANMEAATIPEADAVIRLGGDHEELKIDFTYKDAIGHYLRPMPPIRDGSGSGQVDLKRFALTLDQGHVSPEGGGVLDLAGSTFVIADLEDPVTPGEARIVAHGALADALSLIDYEPLKLTSKLGVPLGEVKGEAQIETIVNLPLLKDLLLEEVQADAKAVLSDVELVAPGIDQVVTAENLVLTADTAAFTLAGDVVVGGLPAQVSWNERFTPSSRRIIASTVATPERLASFGVQQSWFTSGAAPVTLTVSPGASRTTFSVSADLSRGALAAPEINWSKPEGKKAKLSASGVYAQGALTLDKFDLDAGDLAAHGSVAFNAEGDPARIALSRFQFRGAVDLALTAERDKDRWRVVAEGPLLDFTGIDDLIDEAISNDGEGVAAAAEGDADPFRLDVKIDHVQVTDEYAFSDVTGYLRRTRRGAVIADGAGRIGDGAPVQAALRRGEEGGRMTVAIDDAGRFLRDAKVFDDGAGGRMKLEARIGKGEPFRLNGQVRIDDMVIHKDARLELMLKGAELEELRAKMREDGMVFDRIEAPFEYASGKVELDDAMARGPSIGVTISGDYSLEDDSLDMNGVFTPLYRYNSALGKIPVLGKILTGGKGQGVFAFTFAVSGAAANPQVSVNPLSVLAPGILRRLFEGGNPADASVTLNSDGRGGAGDR